MMHPTDHYETLRRGREELLRRAEYERMVRKAMIEQGMNRTIYKAVNWLGTRLLSWGKKFENFGAIAKQPPTTTTTTQVPVRPMPKMSPHH